MEIPSGRLHATPKPGERQTSGDVSRETRSIRHVTDRGLRLQTGSDTLAVYRALQEAKLPGVEELIPADNSLLVVLSPGAPCPEGLLEKTKFAGVEEGLAVREHVVPVVFDGMDLQAVATLTHIQRDELIRRLLDLRLVVRFLGFQPGFAYLGGLPQELCLPRLSRPRKMVPAGSVALGGGYCGIYPEAGPGGWHLLGTAGIRLFDVSANPPALFQPGDFVRLAAA